MARKRRTQSDEELVQRVLEGSMKGRKTVQDAFARARQAAQQGGRAPSTGRGGPRIPLQQ